MPLQPYDLIQLKNQGKATAFALTNFAATEIHMFRILDHNC